jgi:hypothetical protein
MLRATTLACAVLLALGALVALGANRAASAEGATVFKGTGCGVLDGNGNFVLDTEADILQVTTPSGNNLVSCRGTVTPPASGKTAVFKISCTSFGEATTHAIEVVRPNGGYSIECHFNPSGQ